MNEPGICAIHDETLLRDVVPLRYGLIRFTPEYLEARPRLFPNARSFMLGGCMLTPDRPTRTEVYFCPKCREAQSAWARGNPMYPGAQLNR